MLSAVEGSPIAAARRRRRERALDAAVVVAPMALCLWIYWPSVTGWFLMDDFWWLSQKELLAHGAGWRILFQPTAHGTFRPVPEQLLFTALRSLWGFDSGPFHVVVFATQFANLALLGSLARRLTGWRGAALFAPSLWVVQAALALPMTWASSYNQVLASLTMLGSLRLFAWYADSERPIAWALQCALFIAGFGVLELNLVHPLQAAAWALLVAPRERRAALLRRLLPLFALSLAYAAAHLVGAPRLGPYQLRFGPAGLAGSLAEYWAYTVVPFRLWEGLGGWRAAIPALAALSAIGWIGWRARARDGRPAFAAAFYLLALAPLVPLVDHVVDYCLVVPGIGIALGLAEALSTLRRRPAALGMAAAVAVAWAAAMAPAARAGSRAFSETSQRVRAVVGGVIALKQVRPDAAVLLDGVSQEVYEWGLAMRPFECLQLPDVYLSTRTIEALHAEPGTAMPAEYRAERSALARFRAAGRLVVLSAAEDRLRDVTGSKLAPPEALSDGAR
jgi:hypothetical protein